MVIIQTIQQRWHLIELTLLIGFFVEFGDPCARTATTSGTPGTSVVCCPALVQTNSSSTTFIDGLMTFVYNDNNCRTSVTATCSSSTAGLNAAIIANQDNFLSIGLDTTSFPGTCDSNGDWEMGTPPLVVTELQCQLTQAT